MKTILKLVRKTIFAILLLYGYNLIMAPLNLIIPINFITVFAIIILGTPALLGLITILLLMF